MAEPGREPIGLRSVAELLVYRFFIPAYQRGYRWTNEQVTDLLKDVNEFKPREVPNTDRHTWYCLQPIVVKKRANVWEVIDGQQRLTTIYLILHYLNQRYIEIDRVQPFELTYETRPGSQHYLLHELGSDIKSRENIDYWHISQAYKSIHNWFSKAGPTFDRNGFESKFKQYTKVIWYETEDSDEIAIFTRLNVGKIRLTDAELIKALFLNRSNFPNNDDRLRLRQIEIASQWDNMEYSLQQDTFWYFLTGGQENISTRIEFVFNLMAPKPTGKDDYDTFRYFHDKFKRRTEKEALDNWQEIRYIYQTLEEWFTDRYYYHIIGFLISTGTDIRVLLELSQEQETKREFRATLNKLVNGKVKARLQDVEYNKGPVKNILLLHNILTMLYNDETSRFPFDLYKKEKWDIEHISAIAEDAPSSEKHQEDWLSEAIFYLQDDKLKTKAAVYDKTTFPALYEEIIEHFQGKEDPNEIANLTLLDANTNRSYGKSVFPVKRQKIIEKDKLGAFVPVCTKNAFLKFYTVNVDHMTFWGHLDREAYRADIQKVLADYLEQ